MSATVPRELAKNPWKNNGSSSTLELDFSTPDTEASLQDVSELPPSEPAEAAAKLAASTNKPASDEAADPSSFKPKFIQRSSSDDLLRISTASTVLPPTSASASTRPSISIPDRVSLPHTSPSVFSGITSTPPPLTSSSTEGVQPKSPKSPNLLQPPSPFNDDSKKPEDEESAASSPARKSRRASFTSSRASFTSNTIKKKTSHPTELISTHVIRPFKAAESPDPATSSTNPATKSESLHHIQSTLSDSQKIAYVGVCYLLAIKDEREKLASLPNALASHELWTDAHMERIYASLDLSQEERGMIRQLVVHDVDVKDVAKSLVQDAKEATQAWKEAEEDAEEDYGKPNSPPPSAASSPPSISSHISSVATPTKTTDQPLLDVRYTLLTHLLLLSLLDNHYDARSRTLLRRVSDTLEIPYKDLVSLEKVIVDKVRGVLEGLEGVEPKGETINGRKRLDRAGRWVALGAATLAGGAIVGLTAGLAAPLIATGIGAALTMVGVSGGVGIGAFMGGTTGVALIATGGAVTGGGNRKFSCSGINLRMLGLSGFKMLRRTRGISKFEFILIQDAMVSIEKNAQKRAEEKKRRKDRRAVWKKLEGEDASPTHPDSTENAGKTSVTEPEDALKTDVPVISVHLDPTTRKLRSPSEDRERDSSPERRIRRNTTTSTMQRHHTAASSDCGTMDAMESIMPNEFAPISGDLLEERSSVIWEDPDEVTEERREEGESSSDEVWNDGENHRAASEEKEEFSKASVKEMMEKAAKDAAPVASAIEPVSEPKEVTNPPLSILITIAGWITPPHAATNDDFSLPFSVLLPSHGAQHISLIWEPNVLLNLGSAIKMFVGEVTSFVIQQGIQAFVLPVLMAGLTGPMWVMKLTGWVDNPWGIGLARAKKAGLVLADTLLATPPPHSPVTLLGFSLGARVIYYCLLELHRRKAFGLIEQAFMLGTPVLSTPQEWHQISGVVSGRIVNGYLTNDWILGVMYRTSANQWRDVPGLRPVVTVGGIENVCLDKIIGGHLEYRSGLPKILKHVGFEIYNESFEEEDEEEEGLGKKATTNKDLKQLEKETREEISEKTADSKAETAVEKKSSISTSDSATAVSPPPIATLLTATDVKRKSSFRFWPFGKKKEARAAASTSISAPPLTEQDPSAKEVNVIMEEYWQPRELPSTLPPLVIESTSEKKEVILTAFDPLKPPPKAFVPAPLKDVKRLDKEPSNESLGDISTSQNALPTFKVPVPNVPAPPTPAVGRPSLPLVLPPALQHPPPPPPAEGTDIRLRDGVPERWDGYMEAMSRGSSSSDIANGVVVDVMGLMEEKEREYGVEGEEPKRDILGETEKIGSRTELLAEIDEDD
ncbi:hypothetical protein HDU97_002070 [Phlyctochytrium planicorne]|nr:hypothetical protein HDU97_002070 [Phlyctochytrium planicorne]